MADVTVFVDRAVQGHLPGVCVVDGVDTADSLTMRQPVGDAPRLGIASLLLAGPIGWIGLAVLASSQSGRAEMLTVRLPYSEAVAARWQAAARRRRFGWTALAVGVVLGLVVIAAYDNPPLALVAIVAIAWGLGATISGNRRMHLASVGVELDASRRWVRLSKVHPRFAALTRDDVGQRS